jgi:hypothetical protein
MTIRPKAFKTLVAVFFACSVFIAACKKSSTPPSTSTPPVGPSVTALLSASLQPGDTVTILGKGLGTTTANLAISLNDTIALTVYQAKDSIVTAILPAAGHFPYFGSRSFRLDLTLTGSPVYSDSLSVNVFVSEPKGWFKVYGNTTGYFTNPANPIGILFPSDSIGYIFGYPYFLKSVDGGETWQHPNGQPIDYPTCLYAFDSVNLWYGSAVNVLYSSTDGANSWQSHTLPAALSNIVALYMSSPTSGRVASGYGEVYNIAGSFDTTTITAQYQSPYVGTHLDVWLGWSCLDQNNFLGGGSGGIITAETNGVYDEYTLPPPIDSTVVQVQMINNSLGYALDWKNNLLLYSGNRNWSSLHKKGTAFWFTSATNGYIADSQDIYQTTDGGQTWTPVFTLTPSDVVFSFAAKNGKIWALGSNGLLGFIYKYNPPTP